MDQYLDTFDAWSKLQATIIKMGTHQAQKPKDTEEGMALASSKEVSSFGVPTVQGDTIKTMLHVFDCLVQKGVILTILFK